MELWYDTDPGFDDWMAWALIEAEPSFELLGVSVVAGNAPLSVTLPNALAIKAFHGFAAPVHAGCDRPLAQAQVTAQDVLGEQGMETTGPALPPASGAAAAPAPGHGVQALIDCVRARPGRVTLLAVGPLTNVAAAFALAPELPSLLAGLVIMGGAITGGNATATAEFNIHADPEAAARVFDCGVPVAMFGLDVCRQVPIGQPQVERLKALGSEKAAMLAGYVDGYVEIGRRRGRAVQSLYDPTPVIWLARPELFELRPARVDVELQGRFTRGMTVCDLRAPALERANAQVAVKADGPAAMEWAMQRLEALLRD
ncbi:MAG: nucleoside hydrolase [Rubrivivax sp.]